MQLMNGPETISKNNKPIALLEKGPFPDSLDWTSFGVVMGINGQGSCDSEWAFDVAGQFEANLKIHRGISVRLSVQYLLECYDYPGMDKKSLDKCDVAEHIRIENVLNFVLKRGIRAAKNYPYTSFTGKVGECLDTDAKKNSEIYTFGDAFEVIKIVGEEKMVEGLNLYGPLTIKFRTSEYLRWYKEGVYDVRDEVCYEPFHSDLLVGYGTDERHLYGYDEVKKTRFDFGNIKYWKIKHTWGIIFGEHGYLRLTRGRNACGVGDEAFALKLKWPTLPKSKANPSSGLQPKKEQMAAANRGLARL